MDRDTHTHTTYIMMAFFFFSMMISESLRMFFVYFSRVMPPCLGHELAIIKSSI